MSLLFALKVRDSKTPEDLVPVNLYSYVRRDELKLSISLWFLIESFVFRIKYLKIVG